MKGKSIRKKLSASLKAHVLLEWLPGITSLVSSTATFGNARAAWTEAVGLQTLMGLARSALISLGELILFAQAAWIPGNVLCSVCISIISPANSSLSKENKVEFHGWMAGDAFHLCGGCKSGFMPV